MRVFPYILICLVCFAANSLIARVALLQSHIDPVSFSAIRIAAGAIILIPFFYKNRPKDLSGIKSNIAAATALAVYVFFFSLAYVSLDTGFGALILFAMVQITIFAAAHFMGKNLYAKDYIGMLICLLGLMFLFWPFDFKNINYLDVIMMLLSGVAWGVYSLFGARSKNPVADNATNFILLLPFALGILIFTAADISIEGFALAVTSGAITSGLAYSLWYFISSKIGVSILAISQTAVPMIATLMGVIVLSEQVGIKFFIALFCIILGIIIVQKGKSKAQ